MVCSLHRHAKPWGLTNKDGDGGGAHEGADDDGEAVAAVGVQAVGEVIRHGVHKACMEHVTGKRSNRDCENFNIKPSRK